MTSNLCSFKDAKMDAELLNDVLAWLIKVDSGDYSDRFEVVNHTASWAHLFDCFGAPFEVRIKNAQISCDRSSILIRNPGNAFELDIKLKAWLKTFRPKPWIRLS